MNESQKDLQAQLEAERRKTQQAEREKEAALQEIEILRELGTFDGFFKAFFRELKDPDVSHQDAFNTVNERYFKAFGSYRYSDYGSFKVVKSINHKKNRL